jgi:hypothetical protein
MLSVIRASITASGSRPGGSMTRPSSIQTSPMESRDAVGSGGVEVHSHIAGGNVITSRLLLPDLYVSEAAPDVLDPDVAHGIAGRGRIDDAPAPDHAQHAGSLLDAGQPGRDHGGVLWNEQRAALTFWPASAPSDLPSADPDVAHGIAGRGRIDDAPAPDHAQHAGSLLDAAGLRGHGGRRRGALAHRRRQRDHLAAAPARPLRQ